MRCLRVWVRTCAEIFRSALPARLINDIFERRDAPRVYAPRETVCAACTRRRDKSTRPARKTCSSRDGHPESARPRSFDYYLSSSTFFANRAPSSPPRRPAGRSRDKSRYTAQIQFASYKSSQRDPVNSIADTTLPKLGIPYARARIAA